jgi:transposase-like protein
MPRRGKYRLWSAEEKRSVCQQTRAFVSYKDRKTVAAALKKVYKAKDAEAGKAALDAFAEGPWGMKYPAIA